MGALKDWVKQDWVRIGTDGKIKGKCGTSKDKKNPDRCLPRSKANSLSQSQRASTAKKKVKPLFQIPNLQKSQKWGLGEKYLLLRLKDPSMVKLKKDL